MKRAMSFLQWGRGCLSVVLGIEVLSLLLLSSIGFGHEQRAKSRVPASIPSVEMGWNHSGEWQPRWLENMGSTSAGSSASENRVRILFWDLKKQEGPNLGITPTSDSFNRRILLKN